MEFNKYLKNIGESAYLDGYQDAIKDISKVLAQEFDVPCNWNNNDEFTLLNCPDFCEKYCGNIDADKCWEQVSKTKIRMWKDDQETNGKN